MYCEFFLQCDDEDQVLLMGTLFEDLSERPQTPNVDRHMTTPDIHFINMLRYGILALKLLPENITAGLFHIHCSPSCIIVVNVINRVY